MKTREGMFLSFVILNFCVQEMNQKRNFETALILFIKSWINGIKFSRYSLFFVSAFKIMGRLSKNEFSYFW